MLPKKNRNNSTAIKQIFKSGRFINSPNLTLGFIFNKKNNFFPNFSFITPKVVSKKAVERNLLRRRGYAVLKKHINKLPDGFSGAFVFNKGSVKIFGGKKNKEYNPILNLENEIKNILDKIK